MIMSVQLQLLFTFDTWECDKGMRCTGEMALKAHTFITYSRWIYHAVYICIKGLETYKP